MSPFDFHITQHSQYMAVLKTNKLILLTLQSDGYLELTGAYVSEDIHTCIVNHPMKLTSMASLLY